MVSLTAKTATKWRKKGYYVELTEYTLRIPDPKTPGGFRVVKKDLHGFVDMVAMNDDEVIYIQPTSWSNMSARLRKIQTGEVGRGQWRIRMRIIARRLLGFPHVRILIEGWKKDKDKWRYVDKERWVTLEDLEE